VALSPPLRTHNWFLTTLVFPPGCFSLPATFVYKQLFVGITSFPDCPPPTRLLLSYGRFLARSVLAVCGFFHCLGFCVFFFVPSQNGASWFAPCPLCLFLFPVAMLRAICFGFPFGVFPGLCVSPPTSCLTGFGCCCFLDFLAAPYLTHPLKGGGPYFVATPFSAR